MEENIYQNVYQWVKSYIHYYYYETHMAQSKDMAWFNKDPEIESY